MLELSVICVLACHLLCVNLASGVPLACVALEIAAKRGHDEYRLIERLAKSTIVALLVGALLGLLLGWLLWDEAYALALRRLSSKINAGIWELLFSMVLLVIYSALPTPTANSTWKRCLTRSSLPLLAGTNLLYHFPLLFIVLSRESITPSSEFPRIDAAAFRQLLLRDDVLPQAIHFWLAALAVTGVWLILVSARSQIGIPETGANEDGRSQTVALWGARTALLPTLAQIPVGIWLFSRQPGRIQYQLLGGNLIYTTVFVLSIVLALWLMHCLAALASGENRPRVRRLTVVLLIIVVTLMSGVLRHLRHSEPKTIESGRVLRA